MTYARLAADLAVNDPPTFICHFYNFYFAHTAGGRMIGKKMSDTLLDGAKLKFYEWEGDVQEHLDNVRKVGASLWAARQQHRQRHGPACPVLVLFSHGMNTHLECC